ncbi:MAG: 2-succinyl-5-enolpyruvyl-6-hydroxy-3-cyclohexene-1-carboxylic-acid synthase [Flavobacterium sp.]|nr:2-succinyl-5-enolpyruvyl-6-hydroxy-3-cyclohexene-1-carboxylic-acid synthase [Flavobacterium sp.]
MVYPKIPLAQSILQLFAAKGIVHIVLSPGSRNAPLTLGFASNPQFQCYSIADERCAAFFALGIAQQTQKPVAVVCTSGSALLNYYPAFAEAFYSHIPLIVVSADRPANKIDIGDGQTIRQPYVFANHSGYNANLTEDHSAANDRKICEAIDTAHVKKIPVHINVPFEEPLYETISEYTIKAEVSELQFALKPDEIEWPVVTNKWQSCAKKLILIGTNLPDSIDQNTIDYWANDPSVLVFCESTSNVHHPRFISSIDTLITALKSIDFEEFKPDILVTIGGMIVSKRVKAFLREYPAQAHWHIDLYRAYDTFGYLTNHFTLTAREFFTQLAATNTASNYQDLGVHLKKYRAEKQKQFMAQLPFCDLKVFDTVLPTLPDGLQLHLSNSSAIRYAQLVYNNPKVIVFCNRGTSGIDGCTSTAIGAAIGSSLPTLLITGDISFFYDSNALWNAYIPTNFKLIVLNNGGGGIFRILPGHQETELFHTYFETAHCLTAQHLAAMYGFDYLTASSNESLDLALTQLWNQNEQPVLLEIFTPTLANDSYLNDYFKAIE